MGGTFFERAQRYGHLESELTAVAPAGVVFRNLGWCGDTVWAESRGVFDRPDAGYQRMIKQVRELKPAVLVIGYGANEAFAGPAGLSRFEQQYNKLLDDLAYRFMHEGGWSLKWLQREIVLSSTYRQSSLRRFVHLRPTARAIRNGTGNSWARLFEKSA